MLGIYKCNIYKTILFEPIFCQLSSLQTEHNPSAHQHLLTMDREAYSSKHEASAQSRVNIGPSSKTLAQHQPNIGPTPRVCWDAYERFAIHLPVYCIYLLTVLQLNINKRRWF